MFGFCELAKRNWLLKVSLDDRKKGSRNTPIRITFFHNGVFLRPWTNADERLKPKELKGYRWCFSCSHPWVALERLVVLWSSLQSCSDSDDWGILEGSLHSGILKTGLIIGAFDFWKLKLGEADNISQTSNHLNILFGLLVIPGLLEPLPRSPHGKWIDPTLALR